MHRLILDASVVISWCDELQDLVVLESILDSGYAPVTTKTVMNEVLTDGPQVDRVRDKSEIVRTDPVRQEELSNRFLGLGSGELSVLALGERYDSSDVEYSCVLDDGRARNVCDRLDLELMGSIGVFRELVAKGSMDLGKADSLICEMKANGTRLPENHRELIQSPPTSD
ncbi:hypothetical protein [Salinarchaeum laminariae]|uniref:hypothetical protein n=1 Tax=Salinarchaeum laminariae TaxID=869888 RepID=UPI0020BF668B|nr:hypothetical protein [Salinarchaeum laminariae]